MNCLAHTTISSALSWILHLVTIRVRPSSYPDAPPLIAHTLHVGLECVGPSRPVTEGRVTEDEDTRGTTWVCERCGEGRARRRWNPLDQRLCPHIFLDAIDVWGAEAGPG